MTTVRRRITSRRLAVVAVVATSATGLGATGASASHHGETIAHRGGSSATPESTLAAFGSALRHVDGIEFDVQFTRDGVPVVMHDLRVDRTTNCRGAVRSFTWTRLRKCDAGSWFATAFRSQRVPTLNQALTFLQRRSSTSKIFVHVKSPSARQAKVIVKAIRAHGLSHRVTVMGSSRTQLATMKRAGARRLGYCFNTAGGWHSNYPVLIPYNVTVTKALVRKAHKKGQKVYTVEGEPYSEAAGRARGVDGVFVNSF